MPMTSQKYEPIFYSLGVTFYIYSSIGKFQPLGSVSNGFGPDHQCHEDGVFQFNRPLAGNFSWRVNFEDE